MSDTPGVKICQNAMLSGSNVILPVPGQSTQFTISTSYSDLMTYQTNIDTPARTKNVCTEQPVRYANGTLSSNVGVPSCTIEHGFGFTRKPDPRSSTFKCITHDCPTGWERNGMYCKKPLKDYIIDRRSKCDERWNDWFMTPNYHLGNSYQKVNGKCMAPCAPNHIPFYNVDPADGSRATLGGTDKLDRCIPKATYFEGKYEGNSDFCPLAWIHRLNSTQAENVATKITAMYSDFSSSNSINDDFTRKTTGTEVLRVASEIARGAQNLMEKIPPLNEDSENACIGLNTPDRLVEAYDVCQQVKDGTYITNVQQSLPILQDACNAVFCNENNNALDMIGREAICIVPDKDVQPVEDVDVDPPTTQPQQDFFMKSFGWAVSITLTCIIGVVIYFLVAKVLWPKFLRSIWRSFMVLIKRKPREFYTYLDAVEAREQAKNVAKAVAEAKD